MISDHFVHKISKTHRPKLKILKKKIRKSKLSTMLSQNRNVYKTILLIHFPKIKGIFHFPKLSLL